MAQQARILPRGVLQRCWQKSCYLWVRDNELKNEKGEPIEFQRHKFLKDIYDDMTPVQVARKSAQIGYSVMKTLKTMWLAKYRNYNIIYTLPTFSDVGQIVPSKVNALIQQNPILGYWTRDKDTTFQKKIGKSFIYYRGTFAKGVAGKEMEAGVGIMLSADLLCMDEADRSSQVVLTQYESRLEASEYKGKWYFSNPTTPGTVTQDVFERSDQKHWFVKCNNGHWQYLDYFENVRDYKFICKKCGIEITDDNRKGGQWVKKYRNRDISGYWVPHLIVPWVSAAQIQTDYETKPREYFYNFVMGLPYIGSEISVNRDIVLKNIDLTGTPNFQEHNVLGVDSGLIKHWVLGNSQGIFRVGSTKEWQDVENLIKTYNVEVAVFDALPDLTEPRRLRDKYSGRIWLNYYKKQVKKADYTKWDYTTHTVYTDRSKAIQQAITDMVDGKVKFQMDKQDLSDYVDHWENMYQKKEKDNLGIERIIWEAGPSKPDHYVHAHVYWHLGMEKAGRSDRGGVVKTVFGRDKPYAGLAPNIAEELRRQAKFDKYK